MTPDDLANAAIERLAEDEALRGELTDDGYLTLQRWAFDQLARIAQDAAQHPDPSGAMDAAADAVRATLAAAVAAAESGELADLTHRVRPPAVVTNAVPSVRAALQQLALGSDPDTNASAIAAALTVGAPRAAAELRADAVAHAAAPAGDGACAGTIIPGMPDPPESPASAEADCEEA